MKYHLLGSLFLMTLVLCSGRMVIDDEEQSGLVLKPTDYSSAVTVTPTNTTNTTSGNHTNSSSPSNSTANATKGSNGTTNSNTTKTNSTTNTTSGNSTKTNTTTNTTTGNSTKAANTTNSTTGNSTKPANSTGGNSTKAANGTNGTANVTKAWLKYNNTCFGCVVSGFKYCSQSRTCINLADNCTGNASQLTYTTAHSCPVQSECSNFGINGLVFVSN